MTKLHQFLAWTIAAAVLLDQTMPTNGHKYSGGGGGITCGNPCTKVGFDPFPNFRTACLNILPGDEEEEEEEETLGSDPCQDFQLCYYHGENCVANTGNPDCQENNFCEQVDYCGTYGRYCQYGCPGAECELDISNLPCDPQPFFDWLLIAPDSFFDQAVDVYVGPSAEKCRNIRNCLRKDGTGTNCYNIDLQRDCGQYLECDCTSSGCPGIPYDLGGDFKESTIGGDPHIRTWSGDRFDFHGICDVVLLSIVDFDGNGNDMTIHARTKGGFGYSFIEKVAIRLGDAEEDTLEVESFGQYALGGVDNADLTSPDATLGGYVITYNQPNEKEHIFDIVLGKNEHIFISTFKDIVSLKFHIPETGNIIADDNIISFNNSTGLMGRFSDGKLLARDGKTEIIDYNKFGEEWQVLDTEPMIFRLARPPQYPEQCKYPDSSAFQSKHLRGLGEAITKVEAKKACAHLSGKAKGACVEDVMLVGDVDMAKAEDY